MEALPRLLKAKAISVTFWEHFASAPKLWRKVQTFCHAGKNPLPWMNTRKILAPAYNSRIL